MKAVILAGGLGTRLSEETVSKPKPMVEVCGKPILWHIMKTYSHYGINEFVILLGYKGYYIKEYFSNYFLHQSDVTIDMSDGNMEVHNNSSEPWKVTLLDTGLNAMTGARIKKAKAHIGNEPFMLTYGDGLSNVDVDALINCHKANAKMVTVTTVHPGARFGELDIDDCVVKSFKEKPQTTQGWINGGFFVMSPKVLSRIEGPETFWEHEPLKSLAVDGELMAFEHQGFWQPMDTLRDKTLLEGLWANNKAPWKTW
jgi:glucose-1-phosphate cytidylyltransferase